LHSTVAVRVANLDATDFEQLGKAEREGRRQAFIYEKFLRDCVPGFENSSIIGLSHHIGVRETRRVYGEYRLTRDDCLAARRFDDRVLICGAPIEDHRAGKNGEEETAWAYVPDGNTYDVSYRTLVPQNRDEVWVVGRCFSATHDAHASCRSMGQTMSMGQAAGLATSLSIDSRLQRARRADCHAARRAAPSWCGLEMPSIVAQTAAQPGATMFSNGRNAESCNQFLCAQRSSAPTRFRAGWSLAPRIWTASGPPTSPKCRTMPCRRIARSTRGGLDVVTDGEQTRLDFNLSFYGYLSGLELESATPRRFGPPAHDQRGKHAVTGTISAPRGLGVVDEYKRLERLATAQGVQGPVLKASVPGPYTLSGRLLPNADYPTAGR
jgi:hypothetical protein